MSDGSVAASSNAICCKYMNGSGESSSNGDNVGKDNAMVVATTDSGSGGDKAGIVALSVSATRGLLCRG